MLLHARLDLLSNPLRKMVQGRNNLSQQSQHELLLLSICLGVGLWKLRWLQLLFNHTAKLDEQLIVEQAEALKRWSVVFEQDE